MRRRLVHFGRRGPAFDFPIGRAPQRVDNGVGAQRGSRLSRAPDRDPCRGLVVKRGGEIVEGDRAQGELPW